MPLLKRDAYTSPTVNSASTEVRAKAKETLTNATRVFNEEVKPRSKDAWRDAQPDIEHAKARLKRFTQKLRDKYRKGRDGKYTLSSWRRRS